jgi:predicted outer membrane repeat protein
VHVCGSIFENNTAIRGGGALGVVVSDNKAIKSTYEKSIFYDNAVLGLNGEYGQGGAIYHIEDDHNGGTTEENLEIIETTFHGNQARRQGGGAWIYILGHGVIMNTTFEGNSTSAPFNQVGQGGGLVVTLGRIDITNVTFANNHASYQGGAMHGGGSGDPNKVITLTNTIFYNNTLNYGQTEPSETEWQGYHTNRPMTDGGQNIQYPRLKPIYNNEVNNNITANPIYSDPLLGPLGDYGGPNETVSLLSGSPAIDTGAAGCPPTDQRGEVRDGPCDIGAYEYQVDRLTVAPPVQTILPGGVAVYSLLVETNDAVTQPLTLAADNPSPDLQLSFQPAAVLPGEVATLTITDTSLSLPTLPGTWHTIPITATGGSLTLSAEIQLLIGGVKAHLALIHR